MAGGFHKCPSRGRAQMTERLSLLGTLPAVVRTSPMH